jgi:hypothetical protein
MTPLTQGRRLNGARIRCPIDVRILEAEAEWLRAQLGEAAARTVTLSIVSALD